MMQEKQIPLHEEHSDCAVCFCKDFTNLQYLLREYEISIPKKIEELKLTGPQALFLDYSDFPNPITLGEEEIKSCLRAVKQLWKIHMEAIKESSNSMDICSDIKWDYKESAIEEINPEEEFQEDAFIYPR